MIKKKVLILGSSGQIGRHLIRKLTKNNYKAICQTRNSHKAIFLKTSGSIGYIDIVEASIFDKEKLTFWRSSGSKLGATIDVKNDAETERFGNSILIDF